MRRLMTLVSIVGLAVGTVGCGNSLEGTNSSGDILPVDSVVSPSALEARAPGGKGGGGGGGKNGGSTGGSGASSLSLVMVTDKNGNGSANWSDTVTFDVSTSVPEPTVELLCSQNGSVVYGATAGFYASYPWPWTKNMTLSSSSWQGGAADCTAKLFQLGASSTVLATVTFNAGA